MTINDEIRQQTADYCESLVPALLKLVGRVHDGDESSVQRALDHVNAIQAGPLLADREARVRAIIVALAAMVQPRRAADQLLGWTYIEAARVAQLPVRDELVYQCVIGAVPLHALNEGEQCHAVGQLAAEGWSPTEIAKTVGAETWTVQRLLRMDRARRQHPTTPGPVAV